LCYHHWDSFPWLFHHFKMFQIGSRLDLVTNAHRTRNKLARTKTKDQCCWLSKCTNYILGLQTLKFMLNFSFLGLCSLFLQWLFSNNICACMFYVLGRGTLPKTYLVQLNPKPLSCILISWVKKGQFEEGTWCKHNPPQWRSWLLSKTPKEKKNIGLCGLRFRV